MINIPVWIPLISAFIGAISAGIIQTCLQERNRRLEKRSVLVVLTAEISTLCTLIRQRNYCEWIDQLLEKTLEDCHRFHQPLVYLGSDYFSVFHGLTSKIGMLPEADAIDIVEFYGLCKMIADCADPSGINFDESERDGAIQNLQVVQGALGRLLKLGDDLVQRAKPK